MGLMMQCLDIYNEFIVRNSCLELPGGTLREVQYRQDTVTRAIEANGEVND